MTPEFLTNRIEATKRAIVAYEDAIVELSSGVQSYTLDTGQGRQVVTRNSIGEMNRVLDTLYNRLSNLESRLNGGNNVIGRPAW